MIEAEYRQHIGNDIDISYLTIERPRAQAPSTPLRSGAIHAHLKSGVLWRGFYSLKLVWID
jgi:hypothetical protein